MITLSSTSAPETKSSSGFGIRRSTPSPKSTPAYNIPGIVGKETALDNALCMTQSDVVAHAMGVIAVSQDGTHYINRTIVPANQKIPVKCAEAFHFYTSARGEINRKSF